MPYEYGVYELKKKNSLKEKKLLEVIIKEYNLNYFDGYKKFMLLENDSIKNLYFKGDTHWNQDGSNIYSDNLFKFIKEINF